MAAPQELYVDANLALRVGAWCSVRGHPAVVRFVGQTARQDGEWVGVELESPIGKHDGSLGGIRYFFCVPGHGLFVRRSLVTIVPRLRSRWPARTAAADEDARRRASKRARDLARMFPINTLVTIERTHVGEVAFVGTTHFAPGVWLGVRLLGRSAAAGNVDGSVDGVRYFDGTDADGQATGLFVRREAVSRYV